MARHSQKIPMFERGSNVVIVLKYQEASMGFVIVSKS